MDETSATPEVRRQPIARRRRPGSAPGNGGSNARSANDEGGSIGTVSAISSNAFTLSTSTGVKVTVNDTSSTTYAKGTGPASASAVTTGELVLVQPSATGSSTDAAQVVPFQQGAPSPAKQVGQVPANYSEGSGTIMTGATADKAAQPALADYPGGIVDRVVQLDRHEFGAASLCEEDGHHVEALPTGGPREGPAPGPGPPR